MIQAREIESVTYAGLLAPPLMVRIPYKNTRRPTTEGIISQAVY